MNAQKAAFNRRFRWVVLVVYSLLLASTQVLSINFAAVLTMVQQRYQVSELLASGLVLVVPLLFIFTSIPSGALIDSRGYRFTVGLGAVAMTLSTLLRIDESSFWMLMGGQVGVALTMPFVTNGIAKLVADWFGEEHAAVATGLCAIGLYLGLAAGLAVTPALVEAIGLRGAMIAFSAMIGLSTLAFLLLVRPNEHAAAASDSSSGLSGYGPLLRNSGMRLTLVMSALLLGVFNGLTTWLEQIVAPRGINSEQAGLIGGVLILGGVVGAFVVPLLSDKVQRRKPFLIACTTVSALATLALGWTGTFTGLMVLAVLLGFVCMPSYPLLIESAGHFSGEHAAGAAMSLLTLVGNAGGVIVIIAMPIIKGESPDYRLAVVFLVALLLVCAGVALRLPETFARGDAATRSAA